MRQRPPRALPLLLASPGRSSRSSPRAPAPADRAASRRSQRPPPARRHRRRAAASRRVTVEPRPRLARAVSLGFAVGYARYGVGLARLRPLRRRQHRPPRRRLRRPRPAHRAPQPARRALGRLRPYAGVLFDCFGITFPSDNLLGEVDNPAAPRPASSTAGSTDDADPRSRATAGACSARPARAALRRPRPEGGEARGLRRHDPQPQRRLAGRGLGRMHAHRPHRRDARRRDVALALRRGRDRRRTEDFDVLVTEAACASGQSSEDRLSEPRIVVEADAITITFGVTPLEGAQDCQGNPASEVRVELPEPLGRPRIARRWRLPADDCLSLAAARRYGDARRRASSSAAPRPRSAAHRRAGDQQHLLALYPPFAPAPTDRLS